MTNTYYINVTQFENETLFRAKLNVLSPYRQQKIASLKQKKDKYRSLGAGIALDCALADYGIKESNVEYELGEWGKPSLKFYPDIHFSLSHSGDYAICSISDRPVGSDIERARPGKLRVADRFFTSEERAFLYAGKDEEEIMQRMFRIWTMKEGFLKAIGRGISTSMREFSICVNEGQTEIRVKHTMNAMEYHMKEYNEIPGYRVAVCCQESACFADRMKPVNG